VAATHLNPRKVYTSKVKPIRLLSTVLKHRVKVFRYLQTLSGQQRLGKGAVAEQEVPLLSELVKLAENVPGPIVELGTLFGFSTNCIASAKSAGKPLITVDNFGWNPIGLSSAHHRELTRGNLRYLIEKCSTTVFEVTTGEFFRTYKGDRPAMVFIDADHEYEGVRDDIKNARAMKIPIIVGHDYSEAWPGVMRAVKEAFGEPHRRLGTLWAWIDPELSAA
jgi:hypothetical protein